LYKTRARCSSKRSTKIGLGHIEIFFSRTTKPEKLRFTRKLSDRVQIQVCTNHGPQRLGGTTMGKTIFTFVHIGRKNL
jgi:hypothetical protein